MCVHAPVHSEHMKWSIFVLWFHLFTPYIGSFKEAPVYLNFLVFACTGSFSSIHNLEPVHPNNKLVQIDLAHVHSEHAHVHAGTSRLPNFGFKLIISTNFKITLLYVVSLTSASGILVNIFLILLPPLYLNIRPSMDFSMSFFIKSLSNL
jgi:hypothetical protein